jgi:hypothetical protein
VFFVNPGELPERVDTCTPSTVTAEDFTQRREGQSKFFFAFFATFASLREIPF